MLLPSGIIDELENFNYVQQKMEENITEGVLLILPQLLSSFVSSSGSSSQSVTEVRIQFSYSILKTPLHQKKMRTFFYIQLKSEKFQITSMFFRNKRPFTPKLIFIKFFFTCIIFYLFYRIYKKNRRPEVAWKGSYGKFSSNINLIPLIH